MGSLKALMATVLAAIKSALPKIAITTTAIVATTGTIYYYTIDDASYVKGDTSNVPYIVNQEIDKIVEELNNQENLHNYLAILHQDEYYIANLEEMVKNIIKELDKNDSVLRDYISKRNLEEYLKDFIKAELITTYPDLRKSASAIGKDSRDTRLQGHIKLVRYSKGDEKTLTYIKRSEFTQLIDNYNTNGDEDFKEHFTINENGDLVVGGWSYSEGNGTTVKSAYETTINYKQQIQNYTMPFDFLWALLVITEDEEFVHNVAELAIDSQITIGIYDNISTTEEISVKKYKTQEVTEYFPGPGSNYEVIDNEYDGRQTTKNVITQSNTNIVLQYAKTWIAEYEKKFEYVENENEVPSDWEDTASWTSLPDEIISENYTRDHELAYTKKIRNVNVQTANISVTSTYSYNSTNGSGEIKELTDIDKYKKKNFVYYIRQSETALKFILDSPEWVYEVLQASDKTSNMVDLFKYLLYKATGIDFGVTDLNTVLNYLTSHLQNFVDVGSVMDWYKTYMHYAENGNKIPKMNAEGTKYIAFNDGKNYPTVGYGIMIGANEPTLRRIAQEKGITLPNEINYMGAQIDKEVVDATEEYVVTNHLENVQEEFPELEIYQQFALVDIYYQFGNIKHFRQVYGEWDQNKELEYGNCSFPGKDTDLFKLSAYTLEEYFQGNVPLRGFIKTTWREALPGQVKRRKAAFMMFKAGWNVVTHTYCPMMVSLGSNTYSQITGQTWDVEFMSSRGRKFKVYRQGNYDHIPYTKNGWGRTIAKSGCGPSSLSIILSGYGYNLDPAGVVAETGCMQGAWQPMVTYMQKKGFETKQLSTNEQILQELRRRSTNYS